MIEAAVSRIDVFRLGAALLHFLWQGTVIAILYAAVRGVLASRLSAQGRYVLACAALTLMTVAPPLTFLLVTESSGGVSWTVSLVGRRDLLLAVVLIWTLGVLFFSLRLFGALRFTARMRSISNPAPSEWQAALKRIAARVGVTRAVRLLISPLVDVPTVIGWLRPVILVPVEFLTGLPAEHVKALLAHELAHIRRHDYLANILQSIAETVLFYHPAVWWISEQIRAERERCCDDRAVAVSGDVLAYARALAQLESLQPRRFTPALAANGGSLVDRIRRLIEPERGTTENLPAPGAAWAMMLIWLTGVGAATLHGAQTPANIVVSAPAPTVTTSTALLPASRSPFREARNALLYDPFFATDRLTQPPAGGAAASESHPEHEPTAGNRGTESAELPAIKPGPVPELKSRNTDDPLPLQTGDREFREVAPALREAVTPTPTFRSTARLVQIDVVARGRGTAAGGLTKDDFTLLDNGKPQTIALFSATSSLAPGPSYAPLAPGAVSNRLARGGAEPANATVLLVDQRNTGQADQAFVLQRIAKFLRKPPANDTNPERIGIYTFVRNSSLQVAQELTDDRALLLRAANGIQARAPAFREHDLAELTERVMATGEVLQAIARHLASVPGRKNLVWITAGLTGFDPQTETAARALTDAGVALYAVDARGLVGSLSGMTPIANAESASMPSPLQLATYLNPGRMYASGLDTFHRLAELTGGTVFDNNNGIEDSIQKALDDARLGYTLGFYPAPDEPDASWHKLKLQVNKRGISVRYREKYFVPGMRAQESDRVALAALSRDPLDATQLQMAAQTVPDKSRPGFRHVRVFVDLHGVHLENESNTWVGAVDVSFLTRGSQTARTIEGKLRIAGDQLALALENGFSVDNSIPVSSQADELHIVAQDRATGAAGSLRIPLATELPRRDR